MLGNAVRVEATYEPSGQPVGELLKPIEAVLVYPFVLNDTGDHTLLESDDGRQWSRARTTDHVGPAQAIGPMRSLPDHRPRSRPRSP